MEERIRRAAVEHGRRTIRHSRYAIGLSRRWLMLQALLGTADVYTWDTRSGTGLFPIHALQGESKKLNWRLIHEYSD